MNQQQAKTIASVVNAFFKQLGEDPRAYVQEDGDKHTVRAGRLLDGAQVTLRNPAGCARFLCETAADCTRRALT